MERTNSGRLLRGEGVFPGEFPATGCQAVDGHLPRESECETGKTDAQIPVAEVRPGIEQAEVQA